MPQTMSAYTVMLPKFLRNRMLRHSTTFDIEHELVSFFLGYIWEDFARTRVWSRSYFIFITNRGRLPKWKFNVVSFSPVIRSWYCLQVLVFIYRLLRTSLPSYLYSLFKSTNVKQYRFITKLKYESHRT